MSAPDRPTREQVDATTAHKAAALLLAAARVDPKLRAAAEQVQDALIARDAEVRALRAELDREVSIRDTLIRQVENEDSPCLCETCIAIRLDGLRAALASRTPQPAGSVLSQAGAHAWDAADAVAVQLTRAVAAVLARCNDEIENRPGCSCAGPPDFGDGVYGSHEGDCESQEPPMLHAAEVRDLLTGDAPLPAVPDGEDALEPDAADPDDVRQALRAALRGRDEAADEVEQLRDQLDRAHALNRKQHRELVELTMVPPPPFGEDVPARLDAAADALDARGKGLGLSLRTAAEELRRMRPDDRAAVAAALARPTEQQR